MFRYLRKGTFDSEEYGTTHGLQVWDRCEECRTIFGTTHIALHTNDLAEAIGSLFTQWEQRRLTDTTDFANGIRDSFRDAGGWATPPKWETG